ncbi:UDP-N-acetylmuramate--L-alanine ligase [Ehrlichia ruminantium]|uniref:UDP-N-acetylmuramate--L-alanine ligase n=1 Tax=Ehrlichia ruminantium TaxID=779 RepID=A0A170R0C9_EHRRU|nr:UDP-N-acetylmuramate--L-alanine ligase [Ehrlichia ruminantium]GAT77728.1 UDP-N-acetylmuramate--L-alanine ligase [Ehrlichia ruminantium]GAT78908.1 UDP-N-acetylmuramate--L-alanine ligase [Ehrlichia ruminantium]
MLNMTPHVYAIPSAFIDDFFECWAFFNIDIIFNDNTGNTHGIQLRIIPPIKEHAKT